MSVLELEGVWLSFPRGPRHVVRVLEDVSLAVEVGEVVAVLAQRAQGKTTLLRVAAGMVRPDLGVVSFDGNDVWALSDRERSRLLRDEIGWVSCAAPDLDVPVLEKVALPLSIGGVKDRDARSRAMEALERVGARECAQQCWERLADWEQALVAVAKGIARDPRLMLVDDLTALLGIGETDELTRMLADLAKERAIAIVMCVSDASATGWSSRIATLAGGELLGPPTPPKQHGNIIDFPAG